MGSAFALWHWEMEGNGAPPRRRSDCKEGCLQCGGQMGGWRAQKAKQRTGQLEQFQGTHPDHVHGVKDWAT